MVVWLLTHGADPNGDRVMWNGAFYRTAATLQLLIDAGGDVNGEGREEEGWCTVDAVRPGAACSHMVVNWS